MLRCKYTPRLLIHLPVGGDHTYFLILATVSNAAISMAVHKSFLERVFTLGGVSVVCTQKRNRRTIQCF